MKDKEPIDVEESYTCVVCGRQNLKFEEINYKEDKNGQVDLSTVTCMSCGLMSLWPNLKKKIVPGQEKNAEKILERAVKDFEYNYNRRLVRRVLKKKKASDTEYEHSTR